MPANLLCELSGHLMPCTSCRCGKWVEDVCVGQFGVLFHYHVLCCLVGYCTWFSCCAANVGLNICVWYCHVPGHWLSSGPYVAGEWSHLGICCPPAVPVVGSVRCVCLLGCWMKITRVTGAPMVVQGLTGFGKLPSFI